MTPLRVAMVIQRFRPEFSGQGIQMEQLCQALARRGVVSTIIASVRGQPSDEEPLDGYRVRRLRTDLLPGPLRTSGLYQPTFGVRVCAALLREHVDVVHAHGLNDGVYGAAAACRMRGLPLIFEMTLMGVDDPSSVLRRRQWLSRARHRAYRGCDAYVAMSKAFLPSYAAAGMPPERLHVIPQGVDTNRFRPVSPEGRQQARAALGLAPSGPIVAFVGSLIERKGLDVLLGAWAIVHGRRPDARLLLIGQDDFPATSDDGRFLERHSSALPPAARATVHRTGLRDHPERWLAAADVFAFPSRREGFGAVIIEAMACGLPCVVARLDGITDFVFSAPVNAEAGLGHAIGDGIVVPQVEPERLAAALTALIESPDWARQVAAAGLSTARERFDLDRVVAPAYERLYTAVRKRPAGS